MVLPYSEFQVLTMSLSLSLWGAMGWAFRYMSTLYSHPEFPNKGPREINQELMNSVSSNPLRLLMPQHIKQYIKSLWTKKAGGQPVTFTDIFGMLIGETLIPGVRDATFSETKITPPTKQSNSNGIPTGKEQIRRLILYHKKNLGSG